MSEPKSERLDRAQQILKSSPLPMPEAFAAERAIRRMRSALAPRRWYEPTFAQMAGAWAFAAIVLFVVRPSPPPPISPLSAAEIELVTFAEDVALEPVLGAVRIDRGSRFQLPPIDLEHRLVRIELGEIEAALLPGQTLTIVTYQGTIAAVGARFHVEARAGETWIAVEGGDVTVTPHRGADAKVAAGRRVRLSAPAPAVAAPVSLPVTSSGVAPKPIAKLEPRVMIPPPTPAAVAAHNAALKEARTALPQDAPRAARLAEAVLGERPTPAIEVEALALWADAERRQSDLPKAAELYGRVAVHPEGRPYAEEALFQRASIDAQLGRVDAALEGLRVAAKSFSKGPLALERAALTAELCLRAGDSVAAAEALEAAPTRGRSTALDRRRLEVAEALYKSDLPRARSLIEPLLSDNEAARELLSKFEKSPPRSP